MAERGEKARRNLERTRSSFNFQGAEQRTLHVTSKEAPGKKILVAPGLGETSDNFRQTATELAHRGHNVHVLSPRLTYNEKEVLKELHTIKESTRTRYPKLDKNIFEAMWSALPPSEVAKAFALIAYAESMRTDANERVHAIGHSQGGANLLIAAFLRPDLFAHVLLVNPAGQSGKEEMGGPNGLFSRFFRSLLREGNKAGRRHLIGEAVVFLALQGFFHKFRKSRAMREAHALAMFDAFPLLYALSFAEPPVMPTTLYDTGDDIFRQEDVERAEKDAAHAVGAGEGSQPFGSREVTENLGHYHPVTYPKKFAELADRLLS